MSSAVDVHAGLLAHKASGGPDWGPWASSLMSCVASSCATAGADNAAILPACSRLADWMTSLAGSPLLATRVRVLGVDEARRAHRRGNITGVIVGVVSHNLCLASSPSTAASSPSIQLVAPADLISGHLVGAVVALGGFRFHETRRGALLQVRGPLFIVIPPPPRPPPPPNTASFDAVITAKGPLHSGGLLLSIRTLSHSGDDLLLLADGDAAGTLMHGAHVGDTFTLWGLVSQLVKGTRHRLYILRTSPSLSSGFSLHSPRQTTSWPSPRGVISYEGAVSAIIDNDLGVYSLDDGAILLFLCFGASVIGRACWRIGTRLRIDNAHAVFGARGSVVGLVTCAVSSIFIVAMPLAEEVKHEKLAGKANLALTGLWRAIAARHRSCDAIEMYLLAQRVIPTLTSEQATWFISRQGTSNWLLS